MNDLETLLKNLKTLIEKHRSVYIRNETAVREHIILPILNCIGWESNPDYLIPEKADDNSKYPDYTLKKEGTTKTFIEVKKMNLELNSHFNQINSYLSGQHNNFYDYGMLTDGDTWQIYIRGANSLNDSLIKKIKITTDNEEDIKEFFNSIRYDNIDKLNNVLKLEKSLKDKNINSFEDLLHIGLERLEKELKRGNREISCSDIDTFIENKKKLWLIKQTYGIRNEKEILNQENIIVDEIEEPLEDTRYNSTQNNETSKGGYKKISVIFPDGTKINHHKVVDTFVETLQKIGLEKIPPQTDLLSTQSKRYFKQYGQYFIKTQTSTGSKINSLKDINRMLNLGLTIEESQ